MFKRSIAISSLLLSLCAAGSTLAAADDEVTFAQWRSTSTANDIVWNRSGTNGAVTLSQASLEVIFSNLLPGLAAEISDVPAVLTLTDVAETGIAAQSAASGRHLFLDQGGIAGSFAFTTLDAITVGSHTFAAGSNLLSATFADADITGFKGATAASFLGSTETGSLVYTSDFMTFPTGASADFSWGLSSVLPTLGFTGGKALNAFRGNGAGTFAADAPTVIGAPEPATWAIMLLSSAILGARLRGRRSAMA